jgi:protein ImuB
MQHALVFDTPPAAPRTPTATTAAAQRLWFCVYLPNLALEASGPSKDARIVVEEQHGVHRVMLACSQAGAAGIQVGQSANAALALLPTLHIEERSVLREQQALEQLATWFEQFTSLVCIVARDLVLLEVAGSLRLYGGLPQLRQQLTTGLAQQGFEASLAIAPTPLAATWLARAGRRACVREPSNITRVLRGLPLSCLDWPAAICDSIRAMGVTSVGDCLRLPREGFARRFGTQRLLELDRALGRLPDPRASWRAPEKFCGDYEMTEEQSDCEVLLSVCRELLLSQEHFLLTRQLATQQLRFSFFHLRAPATQLFLGGAEFEHRAEHWSDLLRIRFERVQLPEPVIAVRLEGGSNQAMQTISGRLALHGNANGSGRRYSMSQLIERLSARVGHRAVQSVTTVAEHRPQRAWRLQGVSGAGVVTTLAAVRRSLSRPLWMLPEPALLSAEQGYPWLQGRLTLLEGPERLETGWWDDDAIARDYYTAINPQGLQLWVFRNRNRATVWYLHGFFG